MTSSKAKTFRNIIYSSFGKGITIVSAATASFIVARNLSPADYGVVGFAGIIIGFLGQFSDLGVGSAAIRRPTLDQHNLDTAFTLKVILSLGAFAAALLIAPFARQFFDHPATGNVIRILSLNFLVGIVGFLPLIVLTREMNYRALVFPGVASSAVQCSLVVILVLHGGKYWAVVIGSVGGTLAGGIFIQLIRRIPIRFEWDWADMRQYMRFGIPLLGSGVLAFILFNLDNLLVGGSMGSAQLGYYALAFSWGSFICGLLLDTVNNVLFPAFAAIQDDPVAVRRWYLKTVDLVSFVAVIANTALLANAPFFLVTFLGKGTGKWLPALASLQILCVYGIVRAITEPVRNCIMVRGRTETLLHANLLAGAAELVLLLLALRSKRIEVVALAVLAAYLSQAIVYFPFLRREVSIGVWDVVVRIWPIIPALGVGWLITRMLPNSFGNTFLTLTVRGLFTASIVALTHGVFSRFRCFHEAAGLIAQNVSRRAT